MPGLSQLKQFNKDLLSLGDEITIRASRGEKPVQVIIPKEIEDKNDSEEFVLGMPQIEAEVEAAPVEEDLSDLVGLANPSTAGGNAEPAPTFEAPDLSSLLNPINIPDDASAGVDMPDLSMFEEPEEQEEEIVEEEPEEITLSLSSPTQDWGFGSGSKMFVWAWGGSSTGAWYEIYFQPGAPLVGYVDLPADTEAFLVVRTNLSTVTQNWEQDQKTEDVAGKIYNKTDNVTIVDGTTSYTVSFYDYYKG